jgi:hypothetical protein
MVLVVWAWALLVAQLVPLLLVVQLVQLVQLVVLVLLVDFL